MQMPPHWMDLNNVYLFLVFLHFQAQILCAISLHGKIYVYLLMKKKNWLKSFISLYVLHEMRLMLVVVILMVVVFKWHMQWIFVDDDSSDAYKTLTATFFRFKILTAIFGDRSKCYFVGFAFHLFETNESFVRLRCVFKRIE